QIMGSGEEPIAFGLKALKIIIAIPEETEGGTEKLEEFLKQVEGVEEVEIETVHRLS
ncbi:MAG: elongation factor 1-beta, partial [Desulfurococcales archaeon]|nr:elongation factor 1-beta [Desulfurococcales archaeon]